MISSNEHRNNFDFLRLFFSLLVVVSHSFTLAPHAVDREPLMLMSRNQTTLGGVAVASFFIISGFLIAQSWTRSSSFRSYIGKRIRRIYPGYIAAVLLSAVVAAPLASDNLRLTLSLRQGLEVVKSCVLLNTYNAPHTFLTIPCKGEINGSLWSVHYEFMCYLLLATIGAMGLLRRRSVVLILFLIAMAAHAAIDIFQIHIPMERHLAMLVGIPVAWPHTVTCFLAGMVFYLYRARIPHHAGLALISMCACIACCFIPQALGRVMETCGAYLVFWFAFHPAIRLHGAGRYGDFSYGIYVYAFPIQQLIALWTGAWLTPWRLMVLSIPLSVLAGVLSWHLIEKRFLPQRTARVREVIAGEEPQPVPTVLATASST
jgi:peptidoglycan/LPS O-acetylase OafA/YrhL